MPVKDWFHSDHKTEDLELFIELEDLREHTERIFQTTGPS